MHLFIRCLQFVAKLMWTVFNGKVYLVCVIRFILFQLGVFRIKNPQRLLVETVSSGIDYILLVLLLWFSGAMTCAYFYMGRIFIV